jgi:anti-sigma B factor antagonist
MGTPFRLTSTVDGDMVVWWAIGELDLANEHRLVDSVTASFDRGKTVLVDLSQLTFIDASGVRALVRCYRSALACHVRFFVRGAEKNVARVLDVTGVAEPLSGRGN